MNTYIPENYKSALGVYDTQVAISLARHTFEEKLSRTLSLLRVSAPLFVSPESGLNDDLNGIERPVSFDMAFTGTEAQVVHSLAKWKRIALKEYGFAVGAGLYTDMNAIRRDEDMDNIHSVYVDQWDWEKIITDEDRNLDYLKATVKRIVGAICDAHEVVKSRFPQLKRELCREVSFITAQELEDMYPDKNGKEREDLYVRDHKTVFIMQIGGKLKSGQKHDGRAPDYDDWQLNGDILFWDDILGHVLEVSSMGIRVNAESLSRQLIEANCENRRELPFHKMLLNNELPLSIGGGIGQSRLCMLLLEKAHIGEVQVSLWDQETKEACKRAGVMLL